MIEEGTLLDEIISIVVDVCVIYKSESETRN